MRALCVCTFGGVLETAVGKRSQELRLEQEVLESRRMDADVAALYGLAALNTQKPIQ